MTTTAKSTCCATGAKPSGNNLYNANFLRILEPMMEMKDRLAMSDMCYSAWRTCMTCRMQDMGMDCHNTCAETTMMLSQCMTNIMSNSPHMVDIIKMTMTSK
jgi:hypothetical protein